MTYDLHHPTDGKTGQNSPLYGSHTDTDWEAENANCASAVNNWLNAGAEDIKIILGVAFYGKAYQLADPNEHDVGAPVVGDGSVDAIYSSV